MFIFTILAVVSLLLTAAGFFAGCAVNYRWYLAAAAGSYVFSFLSGFSIGLYTLCLTFISLLLAAGHAAGLVKSRLHSVVAATAGLLIWAACIFNIDDYWLFWPLGHIFDLFFKQLFNRPGKAQRAGKGHRPGHRDNLQCNTALPGRPLANIFADNVCIIPATGVPGLRPVKRAMICLDCAGGLAG